MICWALSAMTSYSKYSWGLGSMRSLRNHYLIAFNVSTYVPMMGWSTLAACVWKTPNWEEQTWPWREGLLVIEIRTIWRNQFNKTTSSSTRAGARPSIWGEIMIGKHNSCGLSSSEAAQTKIISLGYAGQASSYCVHRNCAGTMLALWGCNSGAATATSFLEPQASRFMECELGLVSPSALVESQQGSQCSSRRTFPAMKCQWWLVWESGQGSWRIVL